MNILKFFNKTIFLQRCNPDVNKLKWTFPEELKLFLEILSFREKVHIYRYQWCNVFGGFPTISDSLSLKWKRHALPWLILTLFFQRCSVSDLPKLIRQLSTLTVINERAHRAIKIFTDFPHHECLRPFIFRLRISAYEDPRIPRTYAVHHYDRVATEWKQRKYTPPKRLSINI